MRALAHTNQAHTSFARFDRAVQAAAAVVAHRQLYVRFVKPQLDRDVARPRVFARIRQRFLRDAK